MGSCSSREEEALIRNGVPHAKVMESCARKNFSKGYRYNDSDYILFAFNGDIQMIKQALVKKELPDLLSVRGFSQNIQLNLSTASTKLGISSSSSFSELDGRISDKETNKQFSTKMWNPTLFAVYNNQIDIVKYLLLEAKPQHCKHLCLSQSAFKNERSTVPDYNPENECISLLISIVNKNIDMFQFLLNGLHYLWKPQHLKLIINEIINQDWNSNALGLVLNGRCFKQFYNEHETLEDKLSFLNDLFGSLFSKRNYSTQQEDLSSFDDEEQKKFEMQVKQVEETRKKWRFSIQKRLIQSEIAIDFGLFLIKYNHLEDDDSYLQSVIPHIQKYEDNLNFTKKELEKCIQDLQLLDPKIRQYYDALNQQVQKKVTIYLQENENTGVMLLRLIKNGDLLGIQNIFQKLKKLTLEKIFDDYGEVDFTDEEQEELLTLFNTKDVSILRRINPIVMAIIFNQVEILNLFQEKLSIVLRRKHIKGPKDSSHKSIGSNLVFKAACQLKNYSMFIYLWDNYSHLFTINDFCEGSRIAINFKDKIVTKHLFNSHTSHSFFNILSFGFRFVYLNEFVFSELSILNAEKEKNRDYINTLSLELCKQPYSFFSFALFYERGDIFKCLRSLEQTSQRDLRLFVTHNPKSADNFICEIMQDEVAMKLYQNGLADSNNSKSVYDPFFDERPQIPLVSNSLDDLKMKEQYRIENMKLFRQSMDNLAKAIQVELKLYDINELTRSKSSSQN